MNVTAVNLLCHLVTWEIDLVERIKVTKDSARYLANAIQNLVGG
jgi:hypothetical protein